MYFIFGSNQQKQVKHIILKFEKLSHFFKSNIFFLLHYIKYNKTDKSYYI